MSARVVLSCDSETPVGGDVGVCASTLMISSAHTTAAAARQAAAGYGWTHGLDGDRCPTCGGPPRPRLTIDPADHGGTPREELP